jgi:phosphatidylglycerol:prolipoprotein diacylglycerol transferase
MNGIIVNIDPVLLRLGVFEVRWYSLAIVLAIGTAVVVGARRARRKGINPAEIYSMAVWVVLAGVLGARLVHVVDHFGYYANNPAEILQLHLGGLAIWGGLAGGGLAVVIYARIRRLKLGSMVDALAPGMLLAHIVGRIGCIVNGDAYGAVTDVPWAFIYANPSASIPVTHYGVPTHPYPVYEMIWNALSLALVLWVDRRYEKRGLAFLSYVALYSAGRFVLTFVRQENMTLWGLQQAQVIALPALLLSAVFIIYLMRRGKAVEALA